jgi:hypothetical protein
MRPTIGAIETQNDQHNKRPDFSVDQAGKAILGNLKVWRERLELTSADRTKRRERDDKYLVERAAKRIEQFAKNQVISEEQKAILLEKIAINEGLQAALYVGRKITLRHLAMITGYASVLIAIILLARDWSRAAVSMSTSHNWILIPIFYICSTTVFWLAGFLMRKWLLCTVLHMMSGIPSYEATRDNFIGRLSRGWFVFLTLYCGVIYYVLTFLPSSDTLNIRFKNWGYMTASAVIWGLQTWMIVSIYLVCIVCVLMLVHVALIRRHEAMFPDSAIIARLSKLLHTIESKPNKWTEISYKQELLMSLERLAVCTERCLPRKLRSGDLITDTWMKERSGNIAQTYRRWKQGILTPMPDTREALLSHLGSTLFSVASGNWDSVERTPVDASAREKLWHVKIIESARTILTGSLISGFVLCVQRLPGIHVPFGLIYLGPAYAILSLVSLLDPTISTKFEFFKTIKDIVMPEKK